MDKVDLQILSYLKDNARMKASDISKKINFSVSSVIERIRKLEKSGVIAKYTILIDEELTGNNITALAEVTLCGESGRKSLEEYVLNSKNILSCYHVAGDYDFLLKIKASSAGKIEEIHTDLKAIAGIEKVKTYFSMREIKCEITALPDGD